jgi:glycosyltransferase involved in cell wall biosynthesis
MKQKIKRVLKKGIERLGLEVKIINKNIADTTTQVISLSPESTPGGNVLLAYIIDPFLLKPGEPISSAHSHDWESWQMARIFLDMGYHVDIISYLNREFIPVKHYSIFVAARTSFDRLSTLLNKDCLKIVHQDTAHWIFNNHAAYRRLLDVQRRRSVTLKSIRVVEQNWAMENAHCATILGNRFTIDTYRYAGKAIYRVPISSPVVYPWLEDKDFESCRKNFLWFGSAGFVHKGLDLVLEAFARMPDLHLTICGPIDADEQFKAAYFTELYETPNIHTCGWIDVESDDFLGIARKCIAMIYPSCSEGGGGCVITCMHAGLIPVVSYEASVDVEDFGVLLAESTIEAIEHETKRMAQTPAARCREMSRRAWEYARRHHTRETFASAYRSAIRKILDPRAGTIE